VRGWGLLVRALIRRFGVPPEKAGRHLGDDMGLAIRGRHERSGECIDLHAGGGALNELAIAVVVAAWAIVLLCGYLVVAIG
jgi:hypothetical protein